MRRIHRDERKRDNKERQMTWQAQGGRQAGIWQERQQRRRRRLRDQEEERSDRRNEGSLNICQVSNHSGRSEVSGRRELCVR